MLLSDLDEKTWIACYSLKWILFSMARLALFTSPHPHLYLIFPNCLPQSMEFLVLKGLSALSHEGWFMHKYSHVAGSDNNIRVLKIVISALDRSGVTIQAHTLGLWMARAVMHSIWFCMHTFPSWVSGEESSRTSPPPVFCSWRLISLQEMILCQFPTRTVSIQPCALTPHALSVRMSF